MELHYGELFGYVLAGMVGLIAWLGKREVTRLDTQHADHEDRIRAFEKMAGDIMKREDVLAIYHEQREDNREKFNELRQDHKELRADLNAKLDILLSRQKSQRPDD